MLRLHSSLLFHAIPLLAALLSILCVINPPLLHFLTWKAVLYRVNSSSLCAKHRLVQCKVARRAPWSKGWLVRINPSIHPEGHSGTSTLILMFWSCHALFSFWKIMNCLHRSNTIFVKLSQPLFDYVQTLKFEPALCNSFPSHPSSHISNLITYFDFLQIFTCL